MADKLFASETWWRCGWSEWGMLRRDVVAGEVGWEDDCPGGKGVINAGYNRVGIEGGEGWGG